MPAFASPGYYLTLNRVWHNHDRIDLSLPMSLHVAAVPGDETQPAMMYGPLVLAGRLGGKNLTPSMVYLRYSSNRVREPISVPSIQLDSRHPTGWVDPAPYQALTFRTVGQEQTFSLIPLYHLSGGRYVVDWKAKSNAVQELVFKKFEIFYMTIRVSCDFIHTIGSGLLTLRAEGMMRLRTVLLILAGGSDGCRLPSLSFFSPRSIRASNSITARGHFLLRPGRCAA